MCHISDDTEVVGSPMRMRVSHVVSDDTDVVGGETQVVESVLINDPGVLLKIIIAASMTLHYCSIRSRRSSLAGRGGPWRVVADRGSDSGPQAPAASFNEELERSQPLPN